MNAKQDSRFGIGLTVTALALCGAMALTVSCGDDGGGDNGGGEGGQGGDIGGTGGTAGNGGGECVDPPADGVNFCNGRAQGIMTGYAYIALGKLNTATDPVCAPDSSVPDTTRAITAEGTDPGPCPITGTTKWKHANDLCISGKIPVVEGGDYVSNWGLQIGVNTVDPPATDSTGTLGDKGYTTIALTTTGSIEPANQAVRVVIHLLGMAADANPYCATMPSSGRVLTLTSFNTACWDGTGTKLTEADIPNIDKVGIQISSDDKSEYTVTDYCLQGIQFGS